MFSSWLTSNPPSENPGYAPVIFLNMYQVRTDSLEKLPLPQHRCIARKGLAHETRTHYTFCCLVNIVSYLVGRSRAGQWLRKSQQTERYQGFILKIVQGRGNWRNLDFKGWGGGGGGGA